MTHFNSAVAEPTAISGTVRIPAATVKKEAQYSSSWIHFAKSRSEDRRRFSR